MTLLKLSLSGGIMIIAVILLRALFFGKLPKKTFMAIWSLVLLRLLLPFSIPSSYSFYALLPSGDNIGRNEAITQVTPVFEDTPVGNASGGNAAQADNQPVPFQNFNLSPADTAATKQVPQASLPSAAPVASKPFSLSALLPVLPVLWGIGAIALALYFMLTHLYYRRGYKSALPAANPYIAQWLSIHQGGRNIQVRMYDQISAPLTYGLLNPVILLPKNLDLSDREQLNYVLTHETMHIKRLDILLKWLMVAGLCIHWFNPLVWAMYVLFNRDIEMAVDEAVVDQFGYETKSGYALTLIGLEEKKPRFYPMVNNFSKNAIEERILSIMKMKKASKIATLAVLVLMIGITTVFATSPKENKSNPPSAVIAGLPFAPQNEASTITALQASYHNGENAVRYSEDGGKTWLTQEEYNTLYPQYAVQWYTYEEYKAFIEEQRAELSGLIGSKGWTSYHEDFVWTQEMVDDYLALLEKNLEGIRTGTMVISKSINGSDETSLVGEYAAETVIQTQSSFNDIKSGEVLSKNNSAASAQAVSGTANEAIGGYPLTPAEKKAQYAVFEPYGLIYDEQTDALYYYGTRVREFMDILITNGEELETGAFKGAMSSTHDDKGTIDVQTIRDYTKPDENGYGTLTGLYASPVKDSAPMTAEDEPSVIENAIIEKAGGITQAIEGSSHTPMEIRKQYTVCEPYGLTYDEKTDALYYYGTRVRRFLDVKTTNGQSFEGGNFQGISTHTYDIKGTIDVQTIRDYTKLDKNGYGTLTGLYASLNDEEKASALQKSTSSLKIGKNKRSGANTSYTLSYDLSMLEPYGLISGEKVSAMYYGNALVRYFQDVLAPGAPNEGSAFGRISDEQGAVDVETIRDFEKTDERGFPVLVGLKVTPVAYSTLTIPKDTHEAWYLISQIYNIDRSLSLKGYYEQILTLCGGDVGKLFDALAEANGDIAENKIDKTDPLYAFVQNSLTYTGNDLYAQQEISPGDRPYARILARWESNLSDEAFEALNGRENYTDEEWNIFLSQMEKDGAVQVAEKLLAVDFYVYYNIPDQTAVTANQRDDTIAAIAQSMQLYTNSLGEANLLDKSLRDALSAELESITASYSTEKMTFDYKLGEIDRSDAAIDSSPMLTEDKQEEDELITKEYPVSAFNKMAISGAFDVYYTLGDSYSVKVEMPKAFEEQIAVNTIANELVVNTIPPSRKKTAENTFTSSYTYVCRLYITAPAPAKVSLQDSVIFHSKDTLSLSAFELVMAGASSCNLSINTPNFTLHGQDAADITLSGQIGTSNISLYGASSLSAFEMLTQRTKADLSDSARGEIHATMELDATLRGASSLSYKGNPTVTQQLYDVGQLLKAE